jgi:hypothetical protein
MEAFGSGMPPSYSQPELKRAVPHAAAAGWLKRRASRNFSSLSSLIAKDQLEDWGRFSIPNKVEIDASTAY